MFKPLLIITALFVSLPGSTHAQDTDLLSMLEDSAASQAPAIANRVTGIFKGTQLINAPTVEQPGKKNLQFLIMHRFGKISDGGYNFFGLDNAEIRLALDYGLADCLSVGIGRSSLQKTFDGNFKLRILNQQAGKIPLAVALTGQFTYMTEPRKADKPFLTPAFRTAYATQLLLARKFSSRLSIQLAPTIIHFNMVPQPSDKNTLLALGIGSRMKLTNRVSVLSEYNLLPGNQVVSYQQFNSLSLGMEIETGGHVFQLVFTNSVAMNNPQYLAKTLDSWNKGDIFFGFNISRSFNFNKDK